MAESDRSDVASPTARRPGWLAALVVGGVVVDAVLAAAVVTEVLPDPLRSAIFQGPLIILTLIVGTAFVLWRIGTGRAAD